jgi:hypothetical protein
MNTNDDFGNFIQDNKSLLRDYVDTRTELFKLQAIRMSSKTFSILVVVGIVSLLVMFVVFFLGISLSYWFSGLLGSNVQGFALTGGIFILLLLLVILLRKPLFQNPMIRMIIREALQEVEETPSE